MPSMTRGCAPRGKHTPTMRAYTGSLALQLMNGSRRMVMERSRSLARVRVLMTAGTEHPSPMSMGTMLRPDRPSLRNALSMMNATRAM